MGRTDESPYDRIDAKLVSVVATMASQPDWYAAWSELRRESSAEERLRVYQAISKSGVLPHQAGFYLISWHIDEMTMDDETLDALEDRMDSIKEAHGLDRLDTWPLGEGPDEYEDLRADYDQLWEDLFGQKLEECGEHEVARLFREDRSTYHELVEAGREYFHGPIHEGPSDPPPWFDNLIESVAGNLTGDSPAGPLGMRYREEDDFWEISIYPTPVELLGGAHDGEIVIPGFSLDIEGLRSVFAEIRDMGWNSLGLLGNEGPYVWVEGIFQGHEVYVQILADSPEDEEPGMKFDTMPRKEEDS